MIWEHFKVYLIGIFANVLKVFASIIFKTLQMTQNFILQTNQSGKINLGSTKSTYQMVPLLAHTYFQILKGMGKSCQVLYFRYQRCHKERLKELFCIFTPLYLIKDRFHLKWDRNIKRLLHFMDHLVMLLYFQTILGLRVKIKFILMFCIHNKTFKLGSLQLIIFCRSTKLVGAFVW